MRERDIFTRRDAQLVRFQADGPFVLIEPPYEVTADIGGSGELERGHDIVINDVGRIEGHKPINVFFPAGIDPVVKEGPDLGIA